jgi:hypothetical protein
MRWLQAQPNGARIVVVGLAVLQSLALAACERDEPIYYVDGARPSPGANSGVATEGQPPAGCVPWSSERRDVYVCGPVPDSFEPAPPPGDILDYPAVCDIGAAIFRKEAEALMVRNALSTLPVIDVASCGAAGLGSAQEGHWMAKFALANPKDVRPYRSVVLRNFTLDGSGDQRLAGVTLSEEPWPTG